ncbi:MAG: polar amino acid transport system substrate-binding protein [Mycobacteriales bacterium]
MTIPPRRGRIVPALATLCLMWTVAACTSGSRPEPVASGPTSTPTPTATSAAPACDPRASRRPAGPLPAPGKPPAGSYMDTVRKRGLLRLGTSQDTLLFSSRNPLTGVVEGFDVDMGRQVAAAIFGDPSKLQIVVIPNKDRAAAVMSGRVDLVAETMTINCERLKLVDFSTVYYQAGQKVLVARGSAARSIADLGGKRVCAAAGSTSLANLAKVPSHPVGVAAPTQADCLVRFQEGTVDAVSTDDTILAGLAAQDPYARVVGPAFTDEPYGMAISRAHPEFTRFVNAVLERDRSDGTWARLYRAWLGAQFGPAPAPPAARYLD